MRNCRPRSWRALAPVVALTGLLLTIGSVAVAEPLDARTLTKFIDPLPIPGAMPMDGPNHYTIGAWQIEQTLHSELPPTRVYGYGPTQATAAYPGATIVAQRNVSITIRWTNHLPVTHLLANSIDPTIMMAQTTTGVPITTHVHGAEVEPASDGGPMTWFTPNFAETGPAWQKPELTYVNTQSPATIWYHDHAFGYTRLNVYAGLAGFYIVTDPGHEPAGLPAAPYDIGLAIQDRSFTTDGQLWYPTEGVTDIHPIWMPEFFGDAILVNGKVWPYLNVEPRKYRFRILNGANARFFSLALADRATGTPGPAFHQIATDGGYLAEPVTLNDPADPMSPRLVVAPGERAEIVVDFSGFAEGTEFILRNNAKAPYPSGTAADPQTVGQVMLFRVGPSGAPDQSVIPPYLEPVTRLGAPGVTRVMTLNEKLVDGEPVGAFLNGMPFTDAPVTEWPTLGTTEMWEVVNLTGDTHPVHLHLVQFQLLNRQRVNTRRYQRAFEDVNPEIPADHYTPVPVEHYLKGKPTPADANERGWKDTFRMNPGEVTRVLIRFAPQDDATPTFAFDATAEPGYVWHCHILEHEENDMMRPFKLAAATPALARQDAVVTPQIGLPARTADDLELAVRPNPTAGGSAFRVQLTNEGEIALDLFDVAGQRIRRIASGRFTAGEHTLRWDGRDESGRPVASGVYFVQLRADGSTRSHKLVVTP